MPFIMKDHNFTMTGKMWDNITVFCEQVGWDIMFDFNLFYWKDGQWDPSNAYQILKYSAARGVKISSFQLGNEPNYFPNNFKLTVTPPQLVKDFSILRSLLSSFPQYDASSLYGPDVTTLSAHGSSREYLLKFLESGGCDAVAEIGLHHYYTGAKIVKVGDFVDPVMLDRLKDELAYAKNTTFGVCGYNKPLRLTETSSCYGGGAPKLSDAYIAGFMWMDKLGLSAKYGVTHVFRQTFFGGNYGLIDNKLNPNPDYYLSLLFKRLVEGHVFDVDTGSSNPNLRAYAQCARKDYYGYPNGALVLYAMNLGDQDITLSLDQYQNSDLDLFMLTPGDSQGLLSRLVKLNGVTLLMHDSEVPKLLPKRHSGDVTLKARTFGFIVILSADVHLCNIYHA